MLTASEKAGKNQSDVQEGNRSLVLRTIQQRGQCSRIEIARQIGLRQTTVTNIVNDLLRSGAVVEANLIRGAQGRRAIGLTLNNEKYRVIGVRLTRHHILVGSFGLSGEQFGEYRAVIYPEAGVPSALTAIRDTIYGVINQTRDLQVLGIGMGIPGPYLRDSGSIAFMADFPGWDSVPLKDELSRAFPYPIYVEYDAYTGALAEWVAGKCYESNAVLLSVLIEQGLGAGIIQNGEVFSGAQGIAGNIGHMTIDYNGLPCECGSFGCLRNYCTANAILRNLSALLEQPDTKSSLRNVSPLTIQEVISAANAGDPLSRDAIKQAARFLGYGLVNTVYAYNPDVIVLSREFLDAGELFLNEIRAVFQERLRPSIASNITLRFSSVKGDVVLAGASVLAINQILKAPSQHFCFD